MTQRNILSNANRDTLELFTWSNVLMAFDYDGTLAPIVADPDRAMMRPKTRDLLSKLTARQRVVVISGRSQADAMRWLRGTGVHEVVGNHGIEPWRVDPRYVKAVQRWRTTLENVVAPLNGVVIEDKMFSLAIHYRQSREKKKVRAAILRCAGKLRDARVIGGKDVVNIIPDGAPHKGIALLRERERLHCDTAIYVGDDQTDEDVFTLDEPGQLLTVRVGRERSSAAKYCIADQAEMDSLLKSLIDLSPNRSTSPALCDVLGFMRLMWEVDHALQRTSKRMESTLGVTGPQRLVIRIIGRFAGMSAGHLAKFLHVHPSTLTGVLGRLEEQGLISRRPSPDDARRLLLALTDKGRLLDTEKPGTIEAAMHDVIARTPPDKLRATQEVLAAIAAQLTAVGE